MRTLGMVVLLSTVAVGCNGTGASDAGWVHASDALAAHGVAAYRAQATANGQRVLLRDAGGETIGQLDLVQADASSTVSLEFRADSWQQIVVAANGTMTLSLDGRQATLEWNGSAWIGDAAAEALLADSQPYTEFVKLVGGEAQLGGAPAAPSAPATPATSPSPSPSDLGTRPPPTLCCSDVVTTGSGWAWYWEDHADAMACKRATDALEAACAVSSGYDCCNVKAGCTSCVNWGTGYACSTAGYLQYAVPADHSCH